jgi:hypothetical protein
MNGDEEAGGRRRGGVREFGWKACEVYSVMEVMSDVGVTGLIWSRC